MKIPSFYNKYQSVKLGDSPDSPISPTSVTSNISDMPVCESTYGHVSDAFSLEILQLENKFYEEFTSTQFKLIKKALNKTTKNTTKNTPIIRTLKEIAADLINKEANLKPDSIASKKRRKKEERLQETETIEQTISRHKQKTINQTVKTNLVQQRRKDFNSKRAQIFLQMLNMGVDYKCSIERCENKDLAIDHKTPLSKGGSDELQNLQFLCNFHNGKKGVKE